jgi:hypothetical protein
MSPAIGERGLFLLTVLPHDDVRGMAMDLDLRAAARGGSTVRGYLG